MTAAMLPFAGLAQTRVPVIHANVLGPAEWVDYTSGMYTFEAQAPVTLNLEKESRFICVNGGGDYLDGCYYYLSDNDGLGGQYDFRLYVYDADTWIPKNNFRMPGNWSSPDMATDPVTGRFYGTFTTNRSVYRFGWVNPADGEFHDMGSGAGGYPVMGVNRYGAVYAIDREGNLLSVNTADGSAATLYSTGLVPSDLQTGCFDRDGDLFYWCYRDAEDHTALYSLDVNAGSAEGVRLIGAFPQNELMFGAYIRPDLSAADDAPAAPEGLGTKASGDKTVVSFTLPSATGAGAPLGGKPLEYVVVADGVMPSGALPESVAGSDVEMEFAFADGEHTVAVTPVCNGAAGAPAWISFFVGPDTPLPVSALTVSRRGDTFVASWEAPAGGVSGGRINSDAIEYEVKFYHGNVSETVKVAATTFEKEFASPFPVNCHVEVVAVDGDLRSAGAVSPQVMMGNGHKLPYTADFTAGASTSEFLALDANGDGVTWYFESMDDNMRTNYKYDDGDMDDWLFTPILALDTDYFYHLRYDAHTAGLAYEERMEVKAGEGRTPADMTVAVSPAATYTGTSYTTHDNYFTIPSGGNWSVGFHSVTEGRNLYIAIDNITVERGGLMTAPAAVADAKILPAAEGALKCNVSFTAPSLTVGGEPLDEDMLVQLKSGGNVVAEKRDVAPGSAVLLEDVAALQGTNVYNIVCHNGDGAGMPATVEAYAGVDVPLPPANVTVKFNGRGYPVVTWDAPAGGVNGGVVNASGLRYSVRRSFDKQYILDSAAEYIATDNLGLYGVEQALMYYQVYAINDAGTSAPAESVHFTMGTPYALPYSDSFKEMLEMHGPWLGLLLDNPKGCWYIDEEGSRPSCDPVDNDGGMVTFAPVEAGHTASIAAPLVNIEKADYPTLEFYLFCTRDNDSRLEVGVRTAATELETLRSIRPGDASFTPGWNMIRIPLADYQGEQYVQIYFTGFAGEEYTNRIHLDHIGIYDIPRYDVEASLLEVPEEMMPGREAIFLATVTNTGIDAVEDIDVALLREGEPVFSRHVSRLATGAALTLDLNDTADLSSADVVNYSFSVSCASDRNAANDLSAVHEVAVNLPHYPSPGLRGSVAGNMATLEWDAPQCGGVRAPVADGFESYEPFIIDNIGDWTLVDVNGNAGTTGIIDGEGNPLDYPHMGEKMAYQVFNPGQVGFPIYDEDGSRSMYASHRGSQMLCAFSDLDAYNDDWLISPLLPGNEQVVSFYAKSYTRYYGEEAFIVMVNSGVSTATADFSELTEVINTPAEWNRYEFTLPEGTRRFAIRCVSVDQFALCIDDVKFVPESSEAVDLHISGYNVYRDGAHVASLPASATSWSCELDGNSTFRVSAVYDLGESVHSAPIELTLSGIGAIGDGNSLEDVSVRAYTGGLSVKQPDGAVAEVYSTDGRLAGVIEGSGKIALPAAVYIVRTSAGVVKVVVR